MKVPRKMIFNHFFHFWPCQVPLWAVGAEKQPAERPPTEKPKVFQKYLRTWGEGRNDHIELGPSVCQWIQNINLIRLPEGPNWPTVGGGAFGAFPKIHPCWWGKASLIVSPLFVQYF